MNIVLDLDETLVSVTLSNKRAYDFKFKLHDQATNQSLWYYVQKRPHLDSFLRYIFKKFKSVSVWTAATHNYATQVIRHIMTPEQIQRLAFVKTRGDLKVFSNGSYSKPLHHVFKKHDFIQKNNTIMIDDRRSVMVENLGNAIIVPPWQGNNPDDMYLVKLGIVLNGILVNQDIIGLDTHTDVIYLKDIVE
jgi:TFIIF-interacting CTD phosphatase-like protein